MGLFNKAKETAQQAQQAWAQQTGQSRGDGAVHVRGAGLIDPAAFGAPSTRSVSADDAIWEPINGISLQHYAEMAREAQTRGVTDEAGMEAARQFGGEGLRVAEVFGGEPAAVRAWLMRGAELLGGPRAPSAPSYFPRISAGGLKRPRPGGRGRVRLMGARLESRAGGEFFSGFGWRGCRGRRRGSPIRSRFSFRHVL